MVTILEPRPQTTGSISDQIDRLCVEALRCPAVDGVEQAALGRPARALSIGLVADALFSRLLGHNPADPARSACDLELSASHGSMPLHDLLHLNVHDLPEAGLRRFGPRRSRTHGQSQFDLTPAAETSTRPLGQGPGSAAGMAIVDRIPFHGFNRPGMAIVNRRTVVPVSDRDLTQGMAAEAASLPGHLGLDELVCLYHCSQISMDGRTSWTFTEDVRAPSAPYSWQILRVEAGDHDLVGISRALETTLPDTGPPSLTNACDHHRLRPTTLQGWDLGGSWSTSPGPRRRR